MSSSESRRPQWEDLPPEIIEEILMHADDPSLLVLAKVDRFLNHVALAAFFGKEIMAGLLEESTFFSMPGEHSLGRRTSIIRGLEIAVWLRKLDHIHYQPTTSHFFSDLRALARVITKMPTLETLCLYFAHSPPTVTRDELMHTMTELLNVALGKGCQVLKAARAMKFHCAPHYEPPVPTLFQRPIRLPTPPSEMTPSLSLQLCGAFLCAPLSSHTIDLLGCRASTIRHLNFDSSTAFVEGTVWEQILCSIRFPALDTFILDHVALTRVGPYSLATFLSRHPSITRLRICFGSHRNDLFQGLFQPLLPRLHAIESDARIITWLFKDSGIKASVVGIMKGESQPGLLDHALYAVGNAVRQPPERVVLHIRLESRFWSSWMMRHVEDAGSDLRNCKIVKLGFDIDRESKMAPACIDIVAPWIALFPALRHVEFSNSPFAGTQNREVLDARFYRAVLDLCPHLESFRFSLDIESIME